MKYINLIIAGFLSITVYAQEPFYLIEDYGQRVSWAEALLMHDDHLYVTGRVVEIDSLDGEFNMHVRKYTLDGELVKSIIWDNTLDRGEITIFSDDCMQVYNDSIYVVVQLANNVNDAIVKVDPELNEVEFITTYSVSEDIGITSSTHFLDVNSGRTFFALSSNERRNFMGMHDYTTGNTNIQDLSSHEDEYYFPTSIISLRDDTLLLAGYVTSDGFNPEGDFSVHLQKIDKDLQVIQDVAIGANLTGITDWLHSLVNDNEELIVTAKELKRVGTELQADSLRPVIMAFSMDNFELKWSKPVGDGVYKDRFDFVQAMTLGHSGEDYFLAGSKFIDHVAGGPMEATLNKIDKNGNSVWYKTFVDDNDRSELLFRDVIRANNGLYFASGLRIDRDDEDEFTSINQSFIIKFDEDGNIVTRDGLDVVDDIFDAQVRVFPVPTADILFIEMGEVEAMSFALFDSLGKVRKTQDAAHAQHTYMLDTSELESGIYYLHLSNSDGEKVVKEVVVQR